MSYDLAWGRAVFQTYWVSPCHITSRPHGLHGLENNGRKSRARVESQGKDCNVKLLFFLLSTGLMAESRGKKKP